LKFLWSLGFGIWCFLYGAGGGAAMATVRAAAFGFGKIMANKIETQIAPSGSHPGSQIDQRDKNASASKQ
jgi:hypothetical protein